VIVVDTNVMVYLVTGSADHGDRAAALLRTDPNWTAPSILLSELRNVLTGFVRREWVELSDAKAMRDDALAILGDRIAAVDGSEVLAMAASLGLSAYDAEFVVLARELECELISSDREILTAAPDVAGPL
jgi:predicted nucleic acid-binding protein